MSDPKSGTYVSLTDDRSSSDKKHQPEEEEAAVDSGFISSSSVFVSGPVHSDDDDEEEEHDEPKVDALRKHDLTQNDRGDEKLSLKENQSTYLDSGVIDDQEFEADETPEEEDATATAADEMRVEKSLDEWMCGLDLHNNNLNHLSSRKPALSPMEAKNHMPLWQVCYTQDEEGDTQLHLSIIAKYAEAIWTIICIAPDQRLLDIRNGDGQCAMHLAVLSSQPTVIRQLRAAGAQSSIRDRDGNTPLHLACINSDLICVNALTAPITAEERQSFRYEHRKPSTGADLEQRNYDGVYCVHIAAQRNEIDILRQLVKSGADINVREGRCGYTALHYACENANEALVNYILSECTQLQIETCSYGLLTAYQLAADQRNETLMHALKVYGAELLTPPDSEEDYTTDEDDDDAHMDDKPMTNSSATQHASSTAHQSTQHHTIAPACS